MIVYLLLGFFIGLTVYSLFYQYIDPLIQLRNQVREYASTNEASLWNITTMKSNADFYREYPEMIQEEAEIQGVNAVGFEFSPPEEEYYDDLEDKSLKSKI